MKKNIIMIIVLLFACYFIIFGVFNSYFNGESLLRGIFGLDGQYHGSLNEKEREWLKNHRRLIYGADRNAPPLRFVDSSDNQYKGVVVDYINSLSLEMGLEIEMHPLLWEDALKQLAEGKTDICDMFKSPEREKHYLFTKPIYNLRAVLAVRSDDKRIREIGDLKGMTVATQKGDYVNEFLSSNVIGVNYVYVPDINEAINLLFDRKVDAIAGDDPVVYYFLNKGNSKNQIKILDKPLYEMECVLAVPKSEPELVSILNKGIDIIDRKGHLEKIQQKWFGILAPIVTNKNTGKLSAFVIVILVIMITSLSVMMIWTYSLKREVRRRTREVEDSRNELQITFDGMTEYMAVISKDYKIVNTNKAFTTFCSAEKDAIIKSCCRVYLKPFCKICDNCIVEDTFKTGESNCKDVSYDNEVYEMVTYPLTDTHKNTRSILLVIQNVSSDRISKIQLLQANKMIAVGQLAAGVAHEIRNPLGLIRNHSYLIKNMSRELDANIKKSLDIIDTAVQKCSKTIDNLLNFSRITDNSMEWINIKPVIENIIELENKVTQKMGINCAIMCDENIKCYGNAESLKHIFINLFSNAIDAMNTGGTLTIKVVEQEDNIEIECSDTGCGIKESDIEHVFNPFFTTKEPGKGTGLGLYIVYNEVKKMGGSIFVESTVGKGTSFRINLPIKRGHSNE